MPSPIVSSKPTAAGASSNKSTRTGRRHEPFDTGSGSRVAANPDGERGAVRQRPLPSSSWPIRGGSAVGGAGPSRERGLASLRCLSGGSSWGRSLRVRSSRRVGPLYVLGAVCSAARLSRPGVPAAFRPIGSHRSVRFVANLVSVSRFFWSHRSVRFGSWLTRFRSLRCRVSRGSRVSRVSGSASYLLHAGPWMNALPSDKSRAASFPTQTVRPPTYYVMWRFILWMADS